MAGAHIHVDGVCLCVCCRDFSHAQCLVVPWALRQLDEAMYKQEVAHQLNPVKIHTNTPALHPTGSGTTPTQGNAFVGFSRPVV